MQHTNANKGKPQTKCCNKNAYQKPKHRKDETTLPQTSIKHYSN